MHSKTHGVGISLLSLLLSATEIATRAARHENVAVNLDNLFGRQSISVPLGAGMKIIDVLGNEQKIGGMDRQFHNRLMRGVRLCTADALAPLSIPIPN